GGDVRFPGGLVASAVDAKHLVTGPDLNNAWTMAEQLDRLEAAVRKALGGQPVWDEVLDNLPVKSPRGTSIRSTPVSAMHRVRGRSMCPAALCVPERRVTLRALAIRWHTRRWRPPAAPAPTTKSQVRSVGRGGAPRARS